MAEIQKLYPGQKLMNVEQTLHFLENRGHCIDEILDRMDQCYLAGHDLTIVNIQLYST